MPIGLLAVAVVVMGLGLRKIRQSVVRDDSPSVRGMIATVRHLVTVEEVTLSAAGGRPAEIVLRDKAAVSQHLRPVLYR